MRPHVVGTVFTLLLCATSVYAKVKPHTRHSLKIAITFDDLPAHGDLPAGTTRLAIAQSFVGTLHAQHLPPSYGFINGGKVEGDPELEPVLKAWRDGGQLLGNHTANHPDLNDVSAATFHREISENEPLLMKYMAGQDWHWFRYPYLHEGDTRAKRREVRAYLFARHYRIAEVNDDFEDYLWNDPYARCVAKHDDAAIVRLHDSYLATASRYIAMFHKLSTLVYRRDVNYILLLHEGAFDAKMLPELLELYRRHGFVFISLEEAEQDSAYRDDPDIGDDGGGSQLEQMMEKRHLHFPPDAKPVKMLDALCR